MRTPRLLVSVTARRTGVVAWVVAMAIVTIGCGSRQALAEAPAPPSVSFWGSVSLRGADEAEGWTTMRAMAADSDFVFVGTFESFEMGRIFQGDAAEDRVGYGTALVRPLTVVGEKKPDGMLPVEFMLPGAPSAYEATAQAIARALPRGEFVFFLRHKGGKEETGLYRLVNSTGLWSVSDGALDAPLADPDFGTPYAREVKAMRTLDDLVAYLSR